MPRSSEDLKAEGPIDLRQVLADIDAEVAAKRSSGELPVDFERELDRAFARFAPVDAVTGDFDTLVARLIETSVIDTRAPVTSSRPGVAQVKTAVAKAIDWQLRHLATQASGLIHATSRALRLLGDRVDELERRAPTNAETVVAELGRAARPTLAAEPWVAFADDALAGVTGRVCHTECADAAMVIALRQRGVDIYGVDPDERVLSDLAADVADLRTEAVDDHLRRLPAGTLGGLVLSGYVDRAGGPALVQLIDLARRALADRGRLVVLSHRPETWDRPDRALVADVCGTRPWHPATWLAMLERRGFTDVVVSDQDPDAYGVTALR